MKHEALIAAAKDLNTVLGIEPAINVRTSPPVIKKGVLEAAQFITPTDVTPVDEGDVVLNPDTLAVLKELGVDTSKFTIDVNIEQAETVTLEEDEDDPEPIQEAETVPLDEFILECNDFKELKDIVKEYDEFKPMRGIISKFKTVPVLKQEMLKMLGVEVEEDVKEENPKETITPAPKATPKGKKGNEKITFLDKSNEVKGLIIGSKVKFESAKGKENLTGIIDVIKIDPRPQKEYVRIVTKDGRKFHKRSNLITLI